MKEELLTTLAPVLVGLASILGTWILYEVRRWVRARTNNELAFAAIDDIAALVRTTVSDLEQTFRRSAEDGKLTDEEKLEIKAEAHELIMGQVPPLVKRNALRLINNLEDWVNSRIEREVVKSKNGSG